MSMQEPATQAPPREPSAMTHDENSEAAERQARIAEGDLPDPNAGVPEVRIISHSTLVYWWPVWAFGYLFALITWTNGILAPLSPERSIAINSGAGLGVAYVTILLVTIIFTNVKLRGIYSVVLVLTLAFLTVLFAYLGWWDDIFALIPQLSVHMNVGFYLFFSTALLIIWLATFFIFDRITFWRVRPGQMTVEHLLGGAESSYDTRGLLFEQKDSDLVRHVILGLGSGDLKLTIAGSKGQELDIPNVLFADRKVKKIQRLIAVKPDEVAPKASSS